MRCCCLPPTATLDLEQGCLLLQVLGNEGNNGPTPQYPIAAALVPALGSISSGTDEPSVRHCSGPLDLLMTATMGMRTSRGQPPSHVRMQVRIDGIQLAMPGTIWYLLLSVICKLDGLASSPSCVCRN
jgi:hypothetical protein